MSKLEILGAPQSPIVWAVRMAVVEKGVDAEFIDARPHTPEVDAINPFGKIPVMRHGALTLAESRAIALYIDGLAEQNKLVPRELAAAARTEQWLAHFQGEYVPLLLARYLVPYVFPSGPDGKPDRSVIDAALEPVQKALAALEKQLDGHDYITGDFTLADLFYAPMLHYTSKMPEGAAMIAALPRLAAWLRRMQARPSFKATFPPPLPARAAA